MISLKDLIQLDEALNTPYRLENFKRNIETVGSRKHGKHGYAANFTTENGDYYEVIAWRMGFTKAERKEEEERLEIYRQKKAAAKASGRQFLPRIRRGGQGGGMWEVHFTKLKGKVWANTDSDKENPDNWTNEITGTGDAFRVIATVMAFIQELVDDKSPSRLSIKSKPEEKSRGELYVKLAKRYASKIGYKIGKVVTGKFQRIELRKT